MAFKLFLYGSLSLVMLVIGIAFAGSFMHLLNQASENVGAKLSSNLFCGTDYDCKQNPNDCTKCINILEGGFTLLNKCIDNPMPCYCINNECTNSTA